MELSVFLVSSLGEKLNVLNILGMLHATPKMQINKLQGENLTNATRNITIVETSI